jgi:CubicO group peptidase (beta-lactamase class C family)
VRPIRMEIMVRKVIVIIVIMSSFFISMVLGQAIDKNIADTPRGKLALGFIEAFNTGKAEVMREFIEKNWAESSLEEYTVEQWLSDFLSYYEKTRGLTFRNFAAAREHAITLLVQEKLTEAMIHLEFAFDEKPPHKIVDITNKPAREFAKLVEIRKITKEEAAAELDRYINKLVAADAFSGAVLLAKDDKVIFKKAYGLASKRFSVPNKVDTKFNLASMNKMFTALAICQLAEKGKLSFADTIIKHVPDYPNKEVAEKVTIHHLLTHTSGMGHFWNEKFEAQWRRLRTVEDLIPLFADDPLAFEPGEKMQYSNSGFVVLGWIIEKVSGQSYYDYVKQHISEPAGMINTDYYELDKPVPNLAIGYTKMSPDGEPAKEWRNNLFMHRIKGGPAGGGYSTVEDLHKFALALKNHTLLSPEYTEILLTGKVDMGPGIKYAYGFGDHRTDGMRFVGHNGGAPGINTEFRTSPESGYTIVVLSNYDRAAQPVVEKMMNLISQLKK